MSPVTPPTVVLAHAAFAKDAPRSEEGRPSTPGRPTRTEVLGATVPLISAPAYFGPPVVFILGPWLLLVLLLIPPAALLITLVLVVLLGAALLAVVGTLIASPYLIVRHLRARHRVARPEPAVSEIASARGGRAVKRSLRPRPIHITTR
ncbi:MAG TPA: hypothetical protein VMJ65_02165 [Solirubrobacteraceae bacterium]|nr:hypothetical protein [Solirubrobacteraceae bacterium]